MLRKQCRFSSMKAGRFYVSVLAEIPDSKITTNDYSEGIGIDLGLKDFAIISNGKTYKNINKSARLKKLEKRLIREQRCLSRKYENLKKGESTQKANIPKHKLKVQKLYQMMKNRHLSKTVASQKFYEFKVKLQAKCKEKRCEDLRSCIMKRKRKYVPKAISGIDDCGVYRNL